MSVRGVTNEARAALAAAITSGGLTCRKFDTWDIKAGNIATLGLARWLVSEQNDQSYGFRAIVLPVLVYQVVNGSIEANMVYQEQNLEKVIDGLAADRTLGGKVVSSGVDAEDVQQEFYRVQGSGIAYAVASVDVTIRPFANAAS